MKNERIINPGFEKTATNDLQEIKTLVTTRVKNIIERITDKTSGMLSRINIQ